MRLLKHLWHGSWHLKQAFPKETLAAVAQAVQESERHHRGQIRVALEAHVPFHALLKNITPHQRAVEAFSHLRVWDTHENNGVLLYICLADRAVEIVADRAFNKLVSAAEWQSICKLISKHFAQKKFAEGLSAGIAQIDALLRKHFPGEAAHVNELPDAPVIL